MLHGAEHCHNVSTTALHIPQMAGMWSAGPLFGVVYPGIMVGNFLVFLLADCYLLVNRIFGPRFPDRLPFGGSMIIFLVLCAIKQVAVGIVGLAGCVPWEAKLRQEKSLWPMLSTIGLRTLKLSDAVCPASHCMCKVTVDLPSVLSQSVPGCSLSLPACGIALHRWL